MRRSITTAIVLLFANIFYGQSNPKIGCVEKSLSLQAEDLKLTFKKQNMTIYRDATLSMNSLEPFPIEVSLTKGVLYQFIFIGSKDASKIKMELFDERDKKIADKTISPDHNSLSNSNCIIYSFTPSKTDVYLLMLSQKNKSDNKCVSFTIMQQHPISADSLKKK